MNRSLTLTVALALVLASANTWAASDEVTIDTGRLKGVALEGVVSFKGIPFARPPVADLRWRAPQPIERWTGVRSAADYGPDCMQASAGGGATPRGRNLSEDCLYVNVWAPAGEAKKLPVMVWIYGGGFVSGASSIPINDGKYFAKDGIVYVNFNYRLARFGFFAHPALTREQPGEMQGNYGYMDQLAALQWIKKNIAAFGGDPGNITVFGESAGGSSVLTMMTSPLAKGLFQKAIVESGGGRTLLMGRRHLSKSEPGGPPSAESVGLAFARSVGIEGEGPDALAALRKLPAEQVAAGVSMGNMARDTYAGPMIDGKLVVESPGEAYAAGHGMKIPLIIGATSADIGSAPGATIDELFARFGAARDKVRALYDPTGTAPIREVSQALGGDQTMVEPSRFMARTIAATGRPAWEFRFSYVPLAQRATVKGAAHASEVAYVFGVAGGRRGGEPDPSALATAKAMHAYWVNFGKTGNPNGPGLPRWDKYDPKTDIILDFTNEGPVAQPDPRKPRLDAMEIMANQ